MLEQNDSLSSRFITVNDVQYFIKESGDHNGPLILFLHGFPDSWYSWRHQLEVMGNAGFHAVALDMLGYGQTDAPFEKSRYDKGFIADDVAALIAALGKEQAIIVGHDLGASIAWELCLLHPKKVSAIIALSIPYGGRALTRPTDHMKKVFAGRFFYMLYFQEEDIAEQELDEDIETSLLKIFYGLDGEGGLEYIHSLAPKLGEKPTGYLDTLPTPTILPKWLSKRDLEYYSSRFKINGFRAPINWYRNLDAYWERTPHLANKKITQAAYFITGKNDPITIMGKKAIERMPQYVPNLKGIDYVENCGHWIACEQPSYLNQKLLEIIRSL